jgi:hypothetical protein
MCSIQISSHIVPTSCSIIVDDWPVLGDLIRFLYTKPWEPQARECLRVYHPETQSHFPICCSKLYLSQEVLRLTWGLTAHLSAVQHIDIETQSAPTMPWPF